MNAELRNRCQESDSGFQGANSGLKENTTMTRATNSPETVESILGLRTSDGLLDSFGQFGLVSLELFSQTRPGESAADPG
jgi:hypothetical protein